MNEESTTTATRRQPGISYGFLVAAGFLLGILVAAPLTYAVVSNWTRPQTAPASVAQVDVDIVADKLRQALEEQSRALTERINEIDEKITTSDDATVGSFARVTDDIRLQRQEINQLRGNLELVARMVSLENRALYQGHIDEGVARHLAGDYEAAVEGFTKALAISPDSLRAFLNRGMAQQELGNWEEALADFRAAQEIDSENYAPWNNIAWLLATCPDDSIRNGEEAIAAAQRACELSQWQKHPAVSTLAAALAEAGDFDQAKARIREAEKLAPGSAKAILAQQIAKFEAKTPIRLVPAQQVGRRP